MRAIGEIGLTSSTMASMGVFSPLDGIVLAIMLIAIARGCFIGLIREGFSIGSLGAGFLAVRYFTTPVAQWLSSVTEGEIGSLAAPWIAGAIIVVFTLGIIALAGRGMRAGARAAGLGWADRLGGSALGAAEGALAATLVVMGASWWFGLAHPVVAESRSVVAYQEIQSYVRGNAGELPKVAAPRR